MGRISVFSGMVSLLLGCGEEEEASHSGPGLQIPLAQCARSGLVSGTGNDWEIGAQV